MESNNKLQQAFDNFKNELKNAILNETAEMTFGFSSSHGYKYEVNVTIDGKKLIDFSIGDDLVSHYTYCEALNGIFKTKKDKAAIYEIAKKHFKPLTDEALQRIAQLEDEIERIKKGID